MAQWTPPSTDSVWTPPAADAVPELRSNSMIDAFKNRPLTSLANLALGTDPRRKDGVQVNPDSAKMIGATVPALLGAPEAAPNISGMAGKAAHLVNRYILGNPSDEGQTLAGSLAESAMDVGTQLLFAAKAPGMTRELEQYISKLSPTQQSLYKSPRANQAIQGVQDFKDLNIPIAGSTGAVTGSKVQQATDKALGYIPTSMPTMQRAAEAQQAAVQDAGRGIIAKQGVLQAPSVTGAVLQKGADDFIENGKMAFQNRYAAVDNMDGLWVDIAPVKAEALRLKLQMDQGLKNASPQARAILDDILGRNASYMQASGAPQDTIRFTEARALQSDLAQVSRMIDEPVKGKAQSVSSRLSGKLFDAMDAAAKPGLTEDWETLKKINSDYRAFMQDVKQVAPLAQADRPEQTLTMLGTAAAKYPTQAKVIAKALEQMPEAQRGSILANHLDDLMRANPGAQDATGMLISPSSFATRWNGKVYQETKDILFPQGSELRTQLDQFARVGSMLKDSERLANTSRTTPTMIMSYLLQGGPFGVGGGIGGAIGLGAGMAGAGAGLGVALGTPYVTAKIWTNPRVVRWMTEGLQIDPQSTAEWTRHVARLGAILDDRAISKDLKDRYQKFQDQQTDQSISIDRVSGEPTPTRTKFVTMYQGLNQIQKSMAEMPTERRKIMADQNRDALQALPELSAARSTLAQYDKERTRILNDSRMGEKDRRDSLSKIDSQMDRVAGQAMRSIRRFQTSNNQPVGGANAGQQSMEVQSP